MKTEKKKIPKFISNPDPDIYLSNKYVVVDFETTNLEKGTPTNPNNHIVLACWKCSWKPGIQAIFSDELQLNALIRDIAEADFIVAHNAKFELGWLKRSGMDIGTVLPFCTQIADFVISGNRGWKLSLNECLARRKLPAKDDAVSNLIKAGVCPSEISRPMLLKYCGIDVIRTEALFEEQRRELAVAGQLGTMLTRCIVTPVLADIESRGLHLDRDRVLLVHSWYEHRMKELLAELDDITGGIEIKAGPVLRDYLYETLGFKVPLGWNKKPLLTDGGQPKTDKDTLHLLKAETEEQEAFLRVFQEYNTLKSDLSKVVGKAYECVMHEDPPIFRASLNQTIAHTHRLTSTGYDYKIQFQNFPRQFKPLLCARNDGWGIGEADEASLEYRTACFYGQDAAGVADILGGVDAHAYTASIIYNGLWGKSKAQDKQLRQRAKAHTFKPLYGGKSGTPAEQAYYKAFEKKHEGITRQQGEWKREVLNTGELRLPTGLIFYFPDTRVTKYGYVTNSTKICNYPVQSLATADIVPIGLVYLWHELRARGCETFLINTVHDSAIAEVHPDEGELFNELAVKAFTTNVIEYLNTVFGINFNVPLDVEVQIGTHWSNSPGWEAQWELPS